MKKLYSLISLIVLISVNLFAKDIDVSSLPKLLGANNTGTEFYFTFIPAWESNNDDLIIYISSQVRTKVTIDVEGKGYSKSQYTIPNDIIEFTLVPWIGQPHRRTPWEPPETDQVWKNAAVHIISDDPIICYGVTRYQYTSDGFLILPVNTLGKEYIVASYADGGNNSSQWFTSYTGISAAYDKTKVFFTMGGTDWSRTAGGLQPGQTSNWSLNKGDVLLIGSLGQGSDLSGSKVSADKPVSVVSGNFCAYVPTNCGCCDVIEEMEIPTYAWGTEYHVTNIVNRNKNSMVKVFAKEAQTKIYRDHQQMGFIRIAGGIEQNGYLHFRADEGTVRPLVISGDKPIGVTQFNSGQLDDNIVSDPFQMVLVPVEQYQTDITFHTPGIKGGFGFPHNYINLCYEATEAGNLPDDLMFAQFVGGEFEWVSMKDMSPSPGNPFHKIEGGKNFYSKTLLLPGDGVYKLKANDPFQVYSYGFSTFDSYGFPASVSLKSLDASSDSLPPEPNWTIDCEGNAEIVLEDNPMNPGESSGIAMAYMHSDLSYNYKFIKDNFEPCVDNIVHFRLEIIDKTQDASAVITFIDCAGNDTSITIEYNIPRLSIIPDTIIDKPIVVGSTNDFLYYVVNISDSLPVLINSLFLQPKDSLNPPKGFTLWDSSGINQLPDKFTPALILQPQDRFPFIVRFEPTKEGVIWDSIGFGDTCMQWLKSKISFQVGAPIIYISDWYFPPTMLGTSAYGNFTIENDGNLPLEIYDFKGPFITGSVSNVKIYDSQELYDINITPNTPLRLKPHERREAQIKFTPDEQRSYPDSIVFISNTVKDEKYNNNNPIDSIALFNGNGIQSELIATSYNWERKRIDRPGTFPAGPYPVVRNAMNPDTAIRLYNGGSAPITINRIVYTNVVGDTSAFKFNRAALLRTLNPHEEVIIPVMFQPRQTGSHILTFRYETDNPSSQANTTLQGVGIVPRIETYDIDFGATAVNDYDNFNTKTLTIRNLSLEEWEYGDPVNIRDFEEINIYPGIGDWTTFLEPFRYNKFVNDSFSFPIILNPGEAFDYTTQFVAKDTGMFKGYLTTVSDAEYDVTSEWKGYDNDYIIDVKEFSEKREVSIYPNPSEGKLSFISENLIESISIFDLLGREQYSENKIDKNETTINIPELTNGIYFLKIRTGAEIIFRKFIIQK
ncbi:MAG: T9SS type A sorting domain-containing protein [bacterium]